jgi:hypothetical protein
MKGSERAAERNKDQGIQAKLTILIFHASK